MSSFPQKNLGIQPAEVWRDALGPGYAFGVTEGLLRIADAAARKPYRARR